MIFILSIISVIIVILACIILFYGKEGYCKECSHGLGTDHLSSKHPMTHTELLPILEPEFNFREVAKQLLLLEDHLNNSGKRCDDCIKKHCLTAEALMEEAISLDKNRKYEKFCKDIDLPNKLRNLQKTYINTKDYIQTAQLCREIRKPLHVSFFSA